MPITSRFARSRQRILLLCSVVFLALTGCSSRITIGDFTFGPQRSPKPVTVVDNTEPAPDAGISQNWSGYAARGTGITSVTGTWQVPAVQGTVDSDSSTWVGIGGIQSRSLIQAGTDQQIQQGRQYYYAWIELLPAPPQPLRQLDILPGDTVTVTIKQLAARVWEIDFINADSGQSLSQRVDYLSCGCSAEWIEEVPSVRNEQIQLADYGSVTFTRATATVDGTANQTPEMLRARAIRLVTQHGQPISQPQVLHNDSFSIVYLGY